MPRTLQEDEMPQTIKEDGDNMFPPTIQEDSHRKIEDIKKEINIPMTKSIPIQSKHNKNLGARNHGRFYHTYPEERNDKDI